MTLIKKKGITYFLQKWSIHLLLIFITVLLVFVLIGKEGLAKGLNLFNTKKAVITTTPTPTPLITSTPTPTVKVIYIKPTATPSPTNTPVPTQAPQVQAPTVNLETFCKAAQEQLRTTYSAMYGYDMRNTSYGQYVLSDIYSYCLTHNGTGGYQIPPPPQP